MQCRAKVVKFKDLYQEMRQINMNPSYQRESGVWSQNTKANLMDSVINGFDIPKIYLECLEHQGLTSQSHFRWAVVDGKQRLGAISDFVNGKFALSKTFEYTGSLDLAAEEEPRPNQTFTQLHPRIRELIEDFEFSITEIYDANPQEIGDLFVRLNSGVRLNDAELRQGIGGEIIELVGQLEQHQFFVNTVSFKNKRFDHKEIACRLLYLEHCLSNGGAVPNLSRKALDHFTVMNKNMSQAESSSLLRKVEKNLSFMATCFGVNNRELTKSSTQTIYLWLRGLTETYSSERMPTLVRKFLEDFAVARITDAKKPDSEQDEHLKRFRWLSGQGTNSSESMVERAHILTSKFLEANLTDVTRKGDKRSFSEDEKYIIWIRSGKRCENTNPICGVALPDFRSFHADHITPFSRGGQTSLDNAQALCASCNLRKGAR